ncbi:MAG TPA: PilZ domain-containing protein [Vicinamibacterales bacterium]|nr:PilZ domain-containing protein [Vicinamibacterales bacterium]
MERRREGRVAGRGVRARVRLGHRLVIVDVSARGALVEAQCPLRPGSRIEVQLEGKMRGGMVAARVTRCAVAAIHPESGITYRAALAFSESCDWVREAMTQSGYALPDGTTADASHGEAGGDDIPEMAIRGAQEKGRSTK